MTKRLAALLLALAMLLTMLPATASAANQGGFRDVAATAWYHDAVDYVLRKGIMTGMGNNTFSPENTLTRAQLCQILYNIEGKPSAGGGSFTDVDAGTWYSGAVGWAATHEIVNGMGNGLFSPEKPVSREQMVTILYRYADYKGYDLSGLVSLDDYSDVRLLSSWARKEMQWAVGEGIISGMTASTIAPQGTATRAQAATILMRFCENIENDIAFKAKDIDDFNGCEVINFDNSDETNFAVLAEETVVATASNDKNRLVSADDDNGVYKFENADDELTKLRAGDIFYYPYGNEMDDSILLKVGSVDSSGGTVTLTAARAELSDFFEYIDLDMDVNVTEDNLDVREMSDGLALAERSNTDGRDMAKATLKETFKVSVDKALRDGSKLSGTLENAISVTVKMKYDFELFGKDYFEVKFTVKDQLDADVRLSASATGAKDTYRENIGSLMAPVGATGCWLDGDLFYVFDIDASVDLSWKTSLTSTIGFQYDTKNGYKRISEFENDDTVDAQGKLNIALGVGTDIGVSFLKIAKASIEGTAGFELDAKTTDCGLSADKSENHVCVLCVSGNVNAFAQAAFKCKLGVTEKLSVTPVNTSVKLNTELATFYISLLNGASHSEFGWGGCPHKQYLVTVTASDEAGNRLEGITVALTDNGTDHTIGTGETAADGTFRAYCDNGEYSVMAYSSDYEPAHGSVSVNGKAAGVTLTLKREAAAQNTRYLPVKRTVVEDGYGIASLIYLNGDEISGPGTTLYTYDDYGNVLTEQHKYERADDAAVSYTYDANGNVLTKTTTFDWGVGNKTIYKYDTNGNLTAKTEYGTDNITVGTWTYAYDANGRLATETFLDDDYSHTITYSYDSLGRLLTETLTSSLGSDVTTYTYVGENDKPAVINDPWGTTTYTYDNHGNMTSEVNSETYRYANTYDEHGNLIQCKVTLDGENYYTVTYAYQLFTLKTR